MKKIAWLLIFAMLLPIFAGCGEQEAYVPTGNALADADTPVDEGNAPAIVDSQALAQVRGVRGNSGKPSYPEKNFRPDT